MEGAHKTEAFTKLNAYQHIPTLEDGDFAIGESNAILRYIALKLRPYRPNLPLSPSPSPSPLTFTSTFTLTLTLS